MTTRAHITVLVTTLVAVAFVYRLVRARQLRSKYGLLWTTIAAILLPIAVFPGLVNTLSKAIGVYYPPTAFLLLAVGFLFIVVVHYSWELSRMETRLRQLAEEMALLRAALGQHTDAPQEDEAA